MIRDKSDKKGKVVGGRKNLRFYGLALALSVVSVVGCDGLLDVDLPDAVTDIASFCS